MVARMWRAALACQFGLAALAAIIVAASIPLSPTIRLAAFAGIFWCMPVLLFAASLALSRGHAGPGPAHPGPLLRATLADILWFNVAVFAMCLEPRRAGAHAPAAAPRPQPVLLIHGILCNRGVWNRLRHRLGQQGIGPVVATNLEPPLRDLDWHAAAVARQLRELQAQAGGARVTIIAHSMGGLVARAALRTVGPDVVSQLITVGSPHHGVAAARHVHSDLVRQLRPDSPWLNALNQAQEGRFAVPVTSIYSLEDWLIRPPLSAVLRGAEQRVLRRIGHMGLLRRTCAIDCILGALQR